MADRENKATVSDTRMQDAFKQGFDEGMRQAASATIIYEFAASFEGTDLRRVQFSDLDQALAEARNLLMNGHGVSITINAVAVPTNQPEQPQAVAAPQAEAAKEEAPQEDIEDAEVVEEAPSGEKPT